MAAGQPEWPPYDTTDRATMMIAGRCHVAHDPYGQERRLCAELMP